MTSELTLSLARVFGSVALLGAVLLAVSRLARVAGLAPEVSRKLVHVSLGLYCLTFPWVFDDPVEVAATCLLASGVFLLARGALRQSLGGGLHAVSRVSYGELLFAAAVALLFWLKDGHFIMQGAQGKESMGTVLYVLPLVILTLCDAASALIGSSYGRRTFAVEDGRKSWEGVVVFAVTAWLASLIVLLFLTDIGRAEVILLALITAIFGALLEAASWRGLDNLFIPLGIYFLIANLMHFGVFGLTLASAAFLAALVGLILLSRETAQTAHFLAVASTLGFMTVIFAGPESILAPGLAVGLYLACSRSCRVERPPHDRLHLLFVVFAVSVLFFLVSNLLQRDTIFSYNLAFAALAAGVVARFGAPLPWVAAACIAALAVMSVRTVWMEGVSPETLRFAAIGAAAVGALAAIGWMFRRQRFRRPWLVLGGVSLACGLAALPASPA